MTAVIVKLHTRKRPYWKQREETTLALWSEVAGEACVRALERELPSVLAEMEPGERARIEEAW